MHLHVEVACLEEKLLQNLAAARAVGLDEYAERECVVYVGLSDVKDLGVVVGGHFGGASRTPLEWDFLEPDFLLTPLFLVEALLFLADA